MKTLLAVLLLTGLAMGQDQLHNGNYWRSFPHDVKIGYLIGYTDACAWEGKAPASVRHCRFPDPATYAQISDAIDEFYENASNRLISTSDAWSYVKAEVEGRPWSAAKLQQTRKLAATSIVPDSRP
jgi:hypothetical protein